MNSYYLLLENLAGQVETPPDGTLSRTLYNDDRLKAVLTNCRRHGADSQNRGGHSDFRAYLQGRVAWVEAVAPARGLKLRALFDAVAW